jgi:membrane protease YdiL (CAAX protease family)
MTGQLQPASPAHPAPPEPPELPDGVQREPRWPAWYGPAAFGAALLAGVLVSAIVGLIAGALGGFSDGDLDESGPLVTILGTLVVDTILIAAAVLFASFKLRPRPWHFGLRRTRFWPAVGWSVLGMVVFYVVAGAYSALLGPQPEQTVTEDLGLRQSTAYLVLGGILVVVIAPIAEEVFFRGFFYRALRTSLPISLAVLIDGAVFGVIHYTGPDSLTILPVLAVLGAIFCLIYERTGSLYPVIALHALNNTVAFGAQTGSEAAWLLGLALGLAMVAACVVVPRFAWRAAPAAR